MGFLNKKKEVLLRFSLLLVVMLGLVILAKYTALGAYFDMEALQMLVQQAGNWGVLLYLLVFMLGTLMNVPGAVFVVFAVLTYGWIQGVFLAYGGAVLCAFINFWFARFVGGQSLTAIKNQRLQKALSRIDSHPIQTVCWLRAFMLLSPLINYALALTSMKNRQFLLANSIAMIFPMCVILGGVALFQQADFKEAWMVNVRAFFSFLGF